MLEKTITFQIKGRDYDKVQEFLEQHRDCDKDCSGANFEYIFVPSGLGVFSFVKCSCGATLDSLNEDI